ncbi:hypothetical protein OKW42_008277 [Paraburkholderia sp. WC7.3d]
MQLTPGKVTFAQLRDIARDKVSLQLDSGSSVAIDVGARAVADIAAKREPAYGIHTGFGRRASTRIPPDQLELLQKDLVLSHACGVGEPMPRLSESLLMALKLSSRGHSGICREVMDALIKLFNPNVLPLIPVKGSVGASGDRRSACRGRRSAERHAGLGGAGARQHVRDRRTVPYHGRRGRAVDRCGSRLGEALRGTRLRTARPPGPDRRSDCLSRAARHRSAGRAARTVADHLMEETRPYAYNEARAARVAPPLEILACDALAYRLRELSMAIERSKIWTHRPGKTRLVIGSSYRPEQCGVHIRRGNNGHCGDVA